MLNWCRLIIWFHDHLPFMIIYCPTVSITWRKLKLCENGSNIDYLYEKSSVLRKATVTEISGLTFWLRFGSVRVFKNRTEIRIPHIPTINVCVYSQTFCGNSFSAVCSFVMTCKCTTNRGSATVLKVSDTKQCCERKLLFVPLTCDILGVH